MRIEVANSLTDVPPADWNALAQPTGNPFLRHEFLSALERHGCVGPHWGWHPHHLLARRDGRLVGAVPLYLKENSYGEFVFDWAWADAYRRAGRRYYPKLVAAIPYTPVTGQRLLVAPDVDRPTVATALAQGAEREAERLHVSSLHWLFPTPAEAGQLSERGLLRRLGTQFHWRNRGYRDFADFLDGFTAEKRKKLKRERRRVVEAGVALDVLRGDETDERHWAAFHRFYRDTFARHGGHATLSEGFFRELAERMPEAVVLVLARRGGDYLAGALSLRGADALFGRHWGCDEEVPGLHFEACYYTGIEYAIREGLARFEPGAQGEHKVPRGFEPVQTWSAHWIAAPDFRAALEHYLGNETALMQEYMNELSDHLPFRESSP